MTEKSRSSPRENAAELRARALRLLARREHSRAELAAKLAPHAESREAVDMLLELLVSRNQLSDERYAEERARQLARKYGPARVRRELRSKGIAEATVARLAAVPDPLEKAKAILQRRYRGPATTLRERAKRARFLQARGFSVELIRRLLREAEPAEED
jgi:regulatory protein